MVTRPPSLLPASRLGLDENFIARLSLSLSLSFAPWPRFPFSASIYLSPNWLVCISSRSSSDSFSAIDRRQRFDHWLVISGLFVVSGFWYDELTRGYSQRMKCAVVGNSMASTIHDQKNEGKVALLFLWSVGLSTIRYSLLACLQTDCSFALRVSTIRDIP